MIFDDDEDLDRERSSRRWNAYLAQIDAEIREEQAQRATFTADIGKVLEPDIVIKPGSQHANAAFKAGREDEYSNRMKQRYGGEW
jgi:hypothetical protein